MDDEVDDGLITVGVDNHSRFLNLLASMDDIFGFVVDQNPPVYTVPDTEFPRTHPYDAAHNEFNEFNHPWAYPITPVEPCHTYSGPFKIGDDPGYFIGHGIKPNLRFIHNLSIAATPFETTQFCFENLTPDQNMGDPVNFSSFLMWQLARRNGIPDNGHTEWNMDSDRGYAFKSWDWARNTSTLNRDLEGHLYALPCSTLPQIIDGDNSGNPNAAYFKNIQPLDLVYLDSSMTNELDACSKEVRCYSGIEEELPRLAAKAQKKKSRKTQRRKRQA